jgi:transcriptional regulator with XRE-family HTH domain
MTQKELANLSDVKSTYITLIEATGVNLSLTLLLQLATALGVTPQDLFSSSGQGGTSDQTIPLVRTKVVRLKKEIKRLEEEITSLEEILERAPPAGTQLTARPTGRTEH